MVYPSYCNRAYSSLHIASAMCMERLKVSTIKPEFLADVLGEAKQCALPRDGSPRGQWNPKNMGNRAARSGEVVEQQCLGNAAGCLPARRSHCLLPFRLLSPTLLVSTLYSALSSKTPPLCHSLCFGFVSRPVSHCPPLCHSLCFGFVSRPVSRFVSHLVSYFVVNMSLLEISEKRL